jgi:two-component system response regulator WspF
VKIAIVNDLPMAVETLRRIVTANNRHEVVWVAENGKNAIECCAQQIQDLILMDLVMPVMNGVESTRRIMKLSPCPILLVTATVASNSGLVFEAMGAGALDVVATPIIGAEKSSTVKELLEKIDRIGKIIGISAQPSSQGLIQQKEVREPKENGPFLVVIGSSTGGPQALLKVLETIPSHYSAAIVVVQHMDEQFTGGLANWLDSQLDLSVRVMKEGDRPQPGVVLIPSTNNHVKMYPNKTFGYTVDPKDIFYHPSVDVFFNSVARYWRGRCIGVILTGMGNDGAQGMFALHQQGYLTIAQDRESSVVFGMPKAAIELGAAQDVLPLSEIGLKIKKVLTP